MIALKTSDMELLLLSYFDKEEDAMFYYVEDTCLAGEGEMDQVYLTPTIVVCGNLHIELPILSFSHSIFIYFIFSFRF